MTPTDGYTDKGGITVNFDHRCLITKTIMNEASVERLREELPESVHHLIQGFKFPVDEGRCIVDALCAGDLVAACDGSVRGQTGTYGYVLSTRDDGIRWCGYGRVPDTTTETTSQRAEFFGAAAVVTIMSLLQKRINVQSTNTLTTYLDNEGVVDYQKQSEIRKGLKYHLSSDVDIHQYILHLTKHSNIKFEWEWVKGHQDDDKDESDLTLESRLNIEADRLASIGYHLPATTQQFLPGTKIRVTMKGKYISDTNMRQQFVNFDHRGPLVEYIQSKQGWTGDIMKQIDWDMCYEMLEGKPLHKRTNIIKYLHGWQNVGSQKAQFNDNTKEKNCGLCGEIEKQHHYFFCENDKWALHRKRAWTTLKRKLQLSNTDPSIISIISYVISAHMKPERADLVDHKEDNLLEMAIQGQFDIGWKHMFLGRLSVWWSRKQNDFVRNNSHLCPQGKHTVNNSYLTWRKTFTYALIQYGLELWKERNIILHGVTHKDQGYIRRQKAIATATDLFREGEDTVPLLQRRLFINFDQRMEGRTRAIEQWIHLVQIAQKMRTAELKTLATQPNLLQFHFTQDKHTPDNRQINTHRTHITPLHNSLQQPNVSSNNKRVQQDLRQMFLKTHPNVRKRL